MLELFWTMHHPVRPAWSVQYKSAVFFANAEQERLAHEVKARIERTTGQQLYTDILPLKKFYLAEDYHQKYYLKQHRALAQAFYGLYPDEAAFTDSTAVARANGFVGGSGEQSVLEAEIAEYGLSEKGQAALLDIARNSHPVKCAY
jgi:peptide-methionine (S)-S-oxide reductase